MAVHGLSLAEGTRYILRADPAHPDNVKALYESRTKGVQSQEARDEIQAKIDKEVGKPTVFIIGNLLHEDRIFLGDMGGGMEQTPQGTFRMTPKNNAKASEAVRRALRGWENFLDQNGNVIEFKTAPGVGERGQPRSFVSPESMGAMHLDIIKELSAQVLEVNGVTGEIEKKLLSALQAGSEVPSLDGHATDAPTETNSSAGAEHQA